MDLERLLRPVRWLPEARAFWIRSTVLTAATFADGYLTIKGINQNLMDEHNPIVDFYLQTFGDSLGMVAVKTVPALFAILTSAYAYQKGATNFEKKYCNLPIYLGIVAYSSMAMIWEFPEISNVLR